MKSWTSSDTECFTRERTSNSSKPLLIGVPSRPNPPAGAAATVSCCLINSNHLVNRCLKSSVLCRLIVQPGPTNKLVRIRRDLISCDLLLLWKCGRLRSALGKTGANITPISGYYWRETLRSLFVAQEVFPYWCEHSRANQQRLKFSHEAMTQTSSAKKAYCGQKRGMTRCSNLGLWLILNWFYKPFRSQECGSISNSSCSLTRYITSHSMKNLTFHSLLRWNMIITTNSHYLTYTFLFRKVGRMYFLNFNWAGCTLQCCNLGVCASDIDKQFLTEWDFYSCPLCR